METETPGRTRPGPQRTTEEEKCMSDTWHVYPERDLIDHDTAIDHPDGVWCACGPRVEAVKRDDDSVGWLVVHHSLDGREKAENAPQTPPAAV